MCQTEEISLEHLPPEIYLSDYKNGIDTISDIPLKESEYRTILKALNKHHWNTLDTANELKIHRSTLWRKMKKYGLLSK